ncbi:4-hydroxy-tetrahydrodipicolinate synthase [Candidatus Woesearchaeota archaeon CG10_big_fil_rev_8_21_14_0_10_45_16]|nr:MAG: 4-hydroxy-tetrahydrodipicolinate synthase [Candidatus Woesearchaeota archaeon CG10_big_fil_rev_8_21_14_0_10_45_16]
MDTDLSGLYTALVTPFDKDGEVNYDVLGRLIDRQIAAAVDGIVPCGTTGETPTLSVEEQRDIVAYAIERVRGTDTKVIPGTGSNDTKKAVVMTKSAHDAGASAMLVVTPYYNKPTQEGLFRYFSEVAGATDRPIIAYNVPGRTGVNLLPETLERIADANPHVIAVKEASGDVVQIGDIISRFNGRPFYVLSGDDAKTLLVIRRGGHGVISVASNVIPEEMNDLVENALTENYNLAEDNHNRLSPLFDALFIESNPIPVKHALNYLGHNVGGLRSPLCEMDPDNARKLEEVLKNLNLPRADQEV